MPLNVMSSRWLFPLFCAALACSGGCGKDVGELDARDELQPFMEGAKQRERANDIDGAIALYSKGLDGNPDAAKAHLQLGLLYDQQKRDFIRAIFHYEKYLELRPDTERRIDIEELIRLARLSYATSLPDRPSEAIRELANLQGQIGALERDLSTSRDRIRVLQRENEALKGALETAQRPPPAAAAAASPSTIAPQVRTYTVQSGDTLLQIAGKMYGDTKMWRRILEANKATLQRPEDLKAGQVLVIPAE